MKPSDSQAFARSVAGLRLATAHTGMRYKNRDDVALFELAPNSQIAAVFTQNQFCAAPVILARKHLSHQSNSRYLLINAGNANAGTGEDGLRRALHCCAALAQKTGTETEQVLPFSTGVIGQPLNDELLIATIPELLDKLKVDGWDDVANAILTTDTVAKKASATITLNGQEVVLTGVAKGSGMIHPNMATMLAFIATDISVDARDLRALMMSCLNESFNAISVDGDTSTNDACVCVATGATSLHFADLDEPQQLQFRQALLAVMQQLAHAIVLDGEGASKFIQINVSGVGNDADAKAIANTIATSPLVKTAMAASDANWGRIIAAIGRAPVSGLPLETLTLAINDVVIWESNALSPNYSEDQGMRAMEPEKITVDVRFEGGEGHATVWTSDLTTEYVRINADYRS